MTCSRIATTSAGGISHSSDSMPKRLFMTGPNSAPIACPSMPAQMKIPMAWARPLRSRRAPVWPARAVEIGWYMPVAMTPTICSAMSCQKLWASPIEPMHSAPIARPSGPKRRVSCLSVRYAATGWNTPLKIGVAMITAVTCHDSSPSRVCRGHSSDEKRIGKMSMTVCDATSVEKRLATRVRADSIAEGPCSGRGPGASGGVWGVVWGGAGGGGGGGGRGRARAAPWLSRDRSPGSPTRSSPASAWSGPGLGLILGLGLGPGMASGDAGTLRASGAGRQA